MGDKPKNFSQAIDELERASQKLGLGDLNEIQSRLKAELNRIQEQIDGLSDRAYSEAKKAKGKVEDEIHKNPWAAMGVVGLIFFVLGFLFAFKTSRRND